MQAVHVIGAGISGLCSAVALARRLIPRQIAVHLHEAQAQLGGTAASWYAGGMLAPFCEGELADQEVETAGQQAAGWYAAQGVKVEEQGTLVLATRRDSRELDHFMHRTRTGQWVDGTAISELEPHLQGRFQRGIWFDREAHVQPRQAMADLAERFISLGGQLHLDSPMPVSSRAGDGLVVDCRGMQARDHLRTLRGVKGEMLILQTADVGLSRPLRLLHPRTPIYIVPRGHQQFMVGATMVESNHRSRISARALLELLGAAYAIHPAFADAEIVETGCELRPAFPDNIPKIQRTSFGWSVNGMYRHGFLMAPALAETLAQGVEASILKSRDSIREL